MKVKTDSIAALQKVVNEMRQMPQFKRYVEQRKLALIDSKFRIVDELLKIGLLK